MTNDKEWNFVTYAERGETAAISIASLTTYGLVLSQVFNPVALGLAATYGTAVTAFAFANIYWPKATEKLFEHAVKSGKYEKLEDPDDKIVKIAGELSAQLGREAPTVYKIDGKDLFIGQMPLLLRWAFKAVPDETIRPLIKKFMKAGFAALPGLNVVLVTRSAHEHPYTERELRFILAHELSHLHQKDERSLINVSTALLKQTHKALFYAGASAIALSVVGLGLPLTLTTGLGFMATVGGLYGAKYLASAGIATASRIRERRTDRNALYVTRDPEGAYSALYSIETVDGKTPARKDTVGKLTELWLSHPSYFPRSTALAKAWNEKISHYPKLPNTPAPNPFEKVVFAAPAVA